MEKEKHPQRAEPAKPYVKPILTKEKQLHDITGGIHNSQVDVLGCTKQHLHF